jgi:hypothetical protein
MKDLQKKKLTIFNEKWWVFTILNQALNRAIFEKPSISWTVNTVIVNHAPKGVNSWKLSPFGELGPSSKPPPEEREVTQI